MRGFRIHAFTQDADGGARPVFEADVPAPPRAGEFVTLPNGHVVIVSSVNWKFSQVATTQLVELLLTDPVPPAPEGRPS